jgi:hypothetical protein
MRSFYQDRLGNKRRENSRTTAVFSGDAASLGVTNSTVSVATDQGPENGADFWSSLPHMIECIAPSLSGQINAKTGGAFNLCHFLTIDMRNCPKPVWVNQSVSLLPVCKLTQIAGSAGAVEVIFPAGSKAGGGAGAAVDYVMIKEDLTQGQRIAGWALDLQLEEQVRNRNRFRRRFLYGNDQFSKTGSGQRHKETQTERRFRRARARSGARWRRAPPSAQAGSSHSDKAQARGNMSLDRRAARARSASTPPSDLLRRILV